MIIVYVDKFVLTMASRRNTLITENIRKLYFCNVENTEVDLDGYFMANGAYNFTKIAELLQLDLAATAIELQDYHYHLQCCSKLVPLFRETHKLFNYSCSNHYLCVEWLGSNFTHYPALTGETTVEQILFLTALMEHALGNVFYSKTKKHRQPPHLLKDLLSSAELSQVFGADAIAFVKVIMGTPKSLNLRNIVWHGFPQPHEIPDHFVSVLLCICHSLGCILAEQPQFLLQQRKQIENFEYHLYKFNSDDFTIDCDYVDVVGKCKWLSGGHKLYWQQQLFKYYESGAYWQFVLLILPQIELLLRLIYADVNSYDVSAKLDEYYITMDTIFETDVPLPAPASSRNKLLLVSEAHIQQATICVGTMKCLYDMFAAPSGLRLRDKVSHGEVNINAINNAALARILLYLSLHLISSDDTKFPLANYESRFHLNCLCLETLNDASTKLELFCRTHSELKKVHILTCAIIPKDIRIFERCRKEAEIVELMRKIAKCQLQAIQNYDEALLARHAQLSQRELHSNRRRTLEKQVSSLPTVCETLGTILQCLYVVFGKFQTNAEEICADVRSVEYLVKFLKTTLHICENLVKYTHKEHNEWLKSLELCEKFATQRKRIFIWNAEVGEGWMTNG